MEQVVIGQCVSKQALAQQAKPHRKQSGRQQQQQQAAAASHGSDGYRCCCTLRMHIGIPGRWRCGRRDSRAKWDRSVVLQLTFWVKEDVEGGGGVEVGYSCCGHCWCEGCETPLVLLLSLIEGRDRGERGVTYFGTLGRWRCGQQTAKCCCCCRLFLCCSLSIPPTSAPLSLSRVQFCCRAPMRT